MFENAHYKKLCSFSKLSVTSPTSQLIIEPFRRFTYVTAHYRILPSLYLRHSSFSNTFFASPTWQALHLRHLANRPWLRIYQYHEITKVFPTACHFEQHTQVMSTQLALFCYESELKLKPHDNTRYISHGSSYHRPTFTFNSLKFRSKFIYPPDMKKNKKTH